MKLIVVTSPTFFVEETAILESLFSEGLDYLHIRKPDSDPVYCERLLTLLDSKWYRKIVVNDHFYLKKEYGLKGIHLSERHPEMPADYEGYFTKSCSTIEETDYWKRRAGYVVVHDMDDERLHRFYMAKVIDRNVIADQIRAIDDIKKFRDYGFGGVVVDDFLWNQFDPHKTVNYKEIIQIFRQVRKVSG